MAKRNHSGYAPSPGRIAAAQIVGTVVEWYDFIIYGLAASLIFGPLFFPSSNPVTGTLLSIATFGVGFIARPLGATLFGHIGDRYGRKAALIPTLLLMGVSTALIGLLPTFSTVGWLAPALLVILRLTQGLAAGGEWGGAVLIGVEHAEPRKKALFGSFAQVGAPGATILATLAFLLVQELPTEQLMTWGWRLPFLASAVLIPVGYMIRQRITDSPEFTASRDEGHVKRVPFFAVFRSHWKQVLLGLGSFAAIFGTFYLMTTFVLAYATTVSGINRGTSISANLVGATAEAAAIMAGGLLSLKFPARRMAALGGIAITVWALPGYLLIQSGSVWGLYLAVGVSLAAAGFSYGVIASEVGRQFPTSVRYTGLSISYALGAIIGGGLLPFGATWLLQSTGSLTPTIVVTAVIGLVAAACSLALRPYSEKGRSSRADPADLDARSTAQDEAARR